MTLSDLSKTKWFQNNLEVLRLTPHNNEPQVKHCLGLLAASQFKECSQLCEQWILASDAAKDLWRSGTPSAWLANAYSFSTTVAVALGTIVPPKPDPKEAANGAA